MFRLKKGQEAFEVVDGPDAGKKYERDVEYHQPAKGYADRFEPVRTDPVRKDRGKPVPALKQETSTEEGEACGLSEQSIAS